MRILLLCRGLLDFFPQQKLDRRVRFDAIGQQVFGGEQHDAAALLVDEPDGVGWPVDGRNRGGIADDLAGQRMGQALHGCLYPILILQARHHDVELQFTHRGQHRFAAHVVR